MRVELLYAEDDPAYMVARQRLVEVLNEDAFETPIQMIAVATPADAELLDFRGSPTIRIDGVDIDPDSPGPIGLHRRTYRTDDGGNAPVPEKSLIRHAMERARGWAHGRATEGG
jgi:hypothetical protein